MLGAWWSGRRGKVGDLPVVAGVLPLFACVCFGLDRVFVVSAFVGDGPAAVLGPGGRASWHGQGAVELDARRTDCGDGCGGSAQRREQHAAAGMGGVGLALR